jgi:hypothetical protein
MSRGASGKRLGTHRFQRAGFRGWPAGENPHAGSDAYPGAFHRFSASSIEDIHDSSENDKEHREIPHLSVLFVFFVFFVVNHPLKNQIISLVYSL